MHHRYYRKRRDTCVSHNNKVAAWGYHESNVNNNHLGHEAVPEKDLTYNIQDKSHLKESHGIYHRLLYVAD
jgi:hypothetical protein